MTVYRKKGKYKFHLVMDRRCERTYCGSIRVPRKNNGSLDERGLKPIEKIVKPERVWCAICFERLKKLFNHPESGNVKTNS